MRFLGPDDNCPNCLTGPVPAESGNITGAAQYACPACGHTWQTTWSHATADGRPSLTEAQKRAAELALDDPSRFEEPEW